MTDQRPSGEPMAEQPGTAPTPLVGAANPAGDAVSRFRAEIDQAVALLRRLPTPPAYPTATFDPTWPADR